MSRKQKIGALCLALCLALFCSACGAPQSRDAESLAQPFPGPYALLCMPCGEPPDGESVL